MTAILERVPIDRINAEARDVHFWRTVLTVLAGVLFGLGWLVAKIVHFVWIAAVWMGVAVKLGWMEARKTDGRRTNGSS